MKHYSLIVVASFAALSLSCNKVDIQTNNDNNGLVTVKGVVSEEVSTKSDYNINWDSHTATFCWKGAEVFKRMYWWPSSNSEGGYIAGTDYTGTASSSGQTELSFTGSSVSNDTGFAFYPAGSSGAALGWSSAANPLRLHFYDPIPYDSENPIKGIVPMIGKINGAGNAYEFVPITGVFAVRVTNIPAEATKITISSPGTDGGFSLAYSIDAHVANYAYALQNVYENGLPFSTAQTNHSTRSFTFSNLSSAETYYFYFPVPVGTLSGLQIDVADATGSFCSITSTKEVTSIKGVITRLPLITIPTGPNASITGNFNARTANFTYNGADKIKYAISTSSTAQLSTLTASTTSETSVELAPASTGTYYLVYQGYKNDETTKVGPEKRVQFLYVSNNVSDITGVYGINNSSDYKFTLAVVDPVEGDKNIQITTYNSATAAYNGMTGNCKGVFDPASGTITIASCQVLTKNTTSYYLVSTDASNFNSSTWTVYKPNFVLTIQPMANNSAIKFNTDRFSIATQINTGETKFLSGAGQHWSNGTPYLQKNN